jgi:mannitol-1-/sugar-/sorbitol-6-phosphatase
MVFVRDPDTVTKPFGLAGAGLNAVVLLRPERQNGRIRLAQNVYQIESNGKVTKASPMNSNESTPPNELSLEYSSAAIRCSAILFDLDGVLIDSTPSVERVWNRWASEHNLDSRAVVAHAHGRPSLSTVRRFLPNINSELENREVERREIEDAKGIIVLPGATELLASLPPDRWTIATSCTRLLAEARLRAAGLPIPQCMVTATDVTRGKPDPQPFLEAAAKLGFPASDCVVCEDVPAGVLAGKAALARVVAVRSTFPELELRAAGADFVINSCANISATQIVDGLALHLTLVHE